MFTGIIEEVGRVVSTQPRNLNINARRVLEGMELGGSMSVNGVCLTITAFGNNSFSAELMPETIKRSNLGTLSAGDKVNLERPLAVGGRLGGHLVQGHIDATGRVDSMRRDGEAILMRFQAPPEVMCYIVEKGFIAVDGTSLTVVVRDAISFQVSLVGYTRQHTSLGERKAGDLVNLEVDIIAKYVEHLCQGRRTGITADFLKENGFLVG